MGECTGKVRSTPTPKLTLRTVKVSRMPEPWRRMTTPWKTWTRSREPSTTRTWTFSVSPAANSGMSSRRLAWSTRSVEFMARHAPGVGFLGTVRGKRGRTAARPRDGSGYVRGRVGTNTETELLEHGPLLVAQPAPRLQQVGPVPGGAQQRLG